jgi:signal transduction histidine kinase
VFRNREDANIEFIPEDRQNILSDGEKIAWELLNVNEEGVILVDLQANTLFISQAALGHYGDLARAIVGTKIWSYYPASTLHYHKILFNQALRTAQAVTTFHRDGERWIQTMIYPVKAGKDSVECIAFFTRDISQQFKIRETLKRVTLELVNAQEEERHRISQNLHDDIGQRLTALILQLRSVKEALETGQDQVLEQVNSSLHNVETITKHVRQIFYQLSPPSLNRMILPKVLEAYCSSVEEANDLHIDFSSQAQIPELTEKQATVIYRFVQEGLTNVIKHTRATAAWVNLDYTDGDLNISLEDNGQGFDLKEKAEGIGLHGIRERFFSLGGSFEIESGLGKGTRLSGTIPFSSQTNQEKI